MIILSNLSRQFTQKICSTEIISRFRKLNIFRFAYYFLQNSSYLGIYYAIYFNQSLKCIFLNKYGVPIFFRPLDAAGRPTTIQQWSTQVLLNVRNLIIYRSIGQMAKINFIEHSESTKFITIFLIIICYFSAFGIFNLK